ncbi:MAG: Fic family protein [Paracoccaceae bacterium]|nr:Fic family protein [Paracoccaceae bacterium]
MILHELVGPTEDHPAYQDLANSNRERQYGFLKAAVEAALAVDRKLLSQTVIKALNHHAIACLHSGAGEYRPHQVTVGQHIPPKHYRVPDLMDDLVNTVNRAWGEIESIRLSAYVLWRLNWIHPFVNGNGRTARAASYFVFCLQVGVWPKTATILPDLLRRPENEAAYLHSHRVADQSLKAGPVNLDPMSVNLEPMLALFAKLLTEQVVSVQGQVQ